MKTINILFILLIYSPCLHAQAVENSTPGANEPLSGSDPSTIEKSIGFAFGLGWTDNGRCTGRADGNMGGTPYLSDEQQRFYSGTQAFSFEAYSSPKNSWGFIGGFQHNGEQSLSEDKTLHQNQKQSLQNPSKMQMNSTYFGTIYRWDIFYIPFGINIGRVKYTPPNGVSSTLDNSFGIFVTFGWKIYDYLAFEFITQNSNATLTNTTGTEKEEVKGIFGTSSFMLKFLF